MACVSQRAIEASEILLVVDNGVGNMCYIIHMW